MWDVRWVTQEKVSTSIVYKVVIYHPCPVPLVYLCLGFCPVTRVSATLSCQNPSYAAQYDIVSVGTITTMSSWRVLTAIRLTRSASAPACQALPARGRSSLAKAEKQQHKNNQSNENGSKAAVAIASATALALKIFYEEQGQGWGKRKTSWGWAVPSSDQLELATNFLSISFWV